MAQERIISLIIRLLEEYIAEHPGQLKIKNELLGVVMKGTLGRINPRTAEAIIELQYPELF